MDRFRRQVAWSGHHPAVECSSGTISYAHLDDFAEGIAQAVLNALGPQSEPVALLLEHDCAAVAAILGVLKAGKFFVVLDPTHPDEHQVCVLGDCGARLILCGESSSPQARRLAGAGVSVLVADEAHACGPIDDPRPPIQPDACACILYTSGTTGEPKGVIHNHRGVLHNGLRFSTFCGITPADRIALTYSWGYSGSMTLLFSALLNGATLSLLSLQKEGVGALPAWLNRQRITVLFAVPSIFRGMVRLLGPADRFPAVRLLHLGGETVRQNDVEAFTQRFSEGCLLKNGLGFTEINSAVKWFVPRGYAAPNGIVPVGYPMPGIDVLLLDETGKPVPAGAEGELAIRSRYLSPGYWRRPELTQAAFAPDPQGGEARVYRTGDRAVRLPDGCIVHLGRKDLQTKVRGQRVELEGVESAIHGLPGVCDVCVVARTGPDGAVRLVAYVVASPAAANVAALRSQLRKKVPSHMVPAAFVLLNALPTTPNGKVNRAALVEPGHGRPPLVEPFVAPATDVERAIVAVWERVLNIKPIGVRDSFFDVGGDSLTATTLVFELELQLKRSLPPSLLLQATTVAQMAAAISRHEPCDARPVIVPLNHQGSRPPLLLCGISMQVVMYRSLARCLGPEQPVYGVDYDPGSAGVERQPALAAVVAASVAEIRALQPRGPYFLGGYSAGGVWALEIARKLIADGATVAWLALIDTYLPGTLASSLPPLWQRLARHAHMALALKGSRRSWYFRERRRGLGRHVDRLLRKATGGHDATAPRGAAEAAEQTRAALWREMAAGYARTAYPGKIAQFLALDQMPPRGPDPRAAWRAMAAGGWECHGVPGDHMTIIAAEHGAVGLLAAKIEASLANAQGRAAL